MASATPVTLESPTGATVQANPQRHVDTSTWKTYRNEDYGYKFRYPRDYEVQPAEVKLLEKSVRVVSPKIYSRLKDDTLVADYIDVGVVTDPFFIQSLEGKEFYRADQYTKYFMEYDDHYKVAGNQLIAMKGNYCLVKQSNDKAILLVDSSFLSEDVRIDEFYDAVIGVCDTLRVLK